MLVIGLVFMLFACAVFAFYINDAFRKNYDTLSLKAVKVLDELEDDTVVKQTFIGCPDFLGITVHFATYEEVLTGTFTVEIKNEQTGETLLSESLAGEKIADNTGNQFLFDTPLSGVDGALLSVNIHAVQQDSELPFTLWVTDGDQYKKGTLTVNGVEADCDIGMQVLQAGRYSFLLPAYWLFITLILIFIEALYYLFFVRKIKLATGFLIAMLSLGTFSMFLIPLHGVPDEPVHFMTAYRHANKIMGLSSGELKKGEMLWKEGYLDSYQELTTGNQMSDYATIYEHLFEHVENDALVVGPSSSTADIFSYLPQTLGCIIARIFGFNIFIVYYFVRFFNLLFYAGMIYLGIKKIPFGKAVLGILAILPMSLQLAASASYDASIIALGYLFIAYCLAFAYEGQTCSVQDLIITCIAACWLAYLKGGAYFVLGFLCLLIPRGNDKTYLRWAKVGLCCAVVCIFLIPFLLNTFTKVTGDQTLSYTNKTAYSVSYILSDPFHYIHVLFNTIMAYSDFYFKTMLIGDLGWFNIGVPMFLCTAFFVLLVIASFRKENESLYVKSSHKALYAFIALFSFALIVLAMTTGWTSASSSKVEGVQGRYFLPFVPLVFFLFRSKHIVLKKDLDPYLAYTTCFFTLYTMFQAFRSIIT